MPIFYFSGVDRAKHVQLLAREGAAGMVNAAQARSPGLLAALMEYPEVPVVLDSGWHKSLSLEEYIRLLTYLEDSLPGRFGWYSSYDIEKSQQASDACYRELVRRLPHLRTRILWMFHLTWGTKDERMRQVERLSTARSTWQPVGIGGLVPILRRSAPEARQFLQEIGTVLGDFSLPAHVFGLSSPQVLFWLRTQPWVASVDSSRWLAASKSGEVVLLDGSQRSVKRLNLPLTQEEIAAVNIRVMRSWLDPLSAPQMGMWVNRPDGGRGGAGKSAHATQEDLLKWLLSYHSRTSWFQENGSLPESGHWTIYTPLFSIAGREYGLKLWGGGTATTPASEWSVIWSVLPGDPPISPNRFFLIDTRQASGIYSHDEISDPCLCRYPLHLAVAVARAMAPLGPLV